MNKSSPFVAVGKVLGAVACIAVLGYLAACGGEGSGSDETQQFGRLTLRVTDSPVTSARRVVVEFTGVEIKARDGGDTEVFDFAPRQIDLLALDGGGSEILLSEEVLPAGEYEWIRLKVNAGRNASDSFIELDDGSILCCMFTYSGEWKDGDPANGPPVRVLFTRSADGGKTWEPNWIMTFARADR